MQLFFFTKGARLLVLLSIEVFFMKTENILATSASNTSWELSSTSFASSSFTNIRNAHDTNTYDPKQGTDAYSANTQAVSPQKPFPALVESIGLILARPGSPLPQPRQFSHETGERVVRLSLHSCQEALKILEGY